MDTDGFGINKLLVIGVGLIGGSLSLALKKADCVKEVVGVGRTIANLELAVELGVIDRFTHELEEEVADSDVIVVAVPVLSTDSVVERIASTNYWNAIVTDVGSVKQGVVESANRHFDPTYQNFVGGHPIAGREHSGVTAAVSDLFVNHRTVLTPGPNTAAGAVSTIRRMWEATGSVVVEMDSATHDEILSAASHLPHVLAYLLVDYMKSHPSRQECFDLAAGGFYDFTRIASSDPIMWRDICLANSKNILEQLQGYSNSLADLSAKIADGNPSELQDLFLSAKKARDESLAKWLK